MLPISSEAILFAGVQQFYPIDDVFSSNAIVLSSLKELPLQITNLLNKKTKMQISCAVTAQPISTFVFAAKIVQFLIFLNPKFHASSYLLLLHKPDCVRPGR